MCKLQSTTYAMTALRFVFRGFFPVAFIVLFAGCATSKVQVLCWDTVAARGYLNPYGIAYTRVNIDVEKAGQDFRIRMPNGDILQTSTITLQIIWPYTLNGSPELAPEANEGNKFYDVLLPAIWRSGGGYSFEFENGRLVGLGIGVLRPAAPEDGRPAIGSSRTTGLYTLPLTEAQLIELFGAYRSKGVVSGFDTPLNAPTPSDQNKPAQ
jgi:hypothetical protein